MPGLSGKRRRPSSRISRARCGSLVFSGAARKYHSHGLGCLEASLGRRDEALAALRTAIDREPELRGHAARDDDFAALRDDPDFVALVTR